MIRMAMRTMGRSIRNVSSVLTLAGALVLAACTTTGVRQAPIMERTPATTGAAPEAAATPPATREARDGIYVVQKGDTLRQIGAAFGRDPRDIARWNNIDDPNALRPGQELRVVPPPDAAVATPVTPATSAQSRPLTTTGPGISPPAESAPPPAVAAAPPAAAAVAPSAALPAGLTWAWPLTGKLIEKFDEKRNKGIDIGAREGDPVLAASDGSVVYSGSGLRGYGNLVIVKHNDEFISAYAHNRLILVKQGQTVKRGQRIAEAGKSDASTPKLHFEIRRGGKPVDPLQYLPPR
jgi:lipoprotein NlpD